MQSIFSNSSNNCWWEGMQDTIWFWKEITRRSFLGENVLYTQISQFPNTVAWLDHESSWIHRFDASLWPKDILWQSLQSPCNSHKWVLNSPFWFGTHQNFNFFIFTMVGSEMVSRLIKINCYNKLCPFTVR